MNKNIFRPFEWKCVQYKQKLKTRTNFFYWIRNENSGYAATVLNPRYITRISWRVNLVSRHRSSKATGIGFGVRADGSSSNRTTSSSIGLSGGVAMVACNFSTSVLRYVTFLPLIYAPMFRSFDGVFASLTRVLDFFLLSLARSAPAKKKKMFLTSVFFSFVLLIIVAAFQSLFETMPVGKR